MRYSLILASFAVAAIAAPVVQLEANAIKREAEAQMSRQPVQPVKPGSSRPPPRTAAAESLDINNDIDVTINDQNVENSARSAEAKSGKPRPPCNNRNCPDYPGGRGRRSADPITNTPGTHANDRPSLGSKSKPKPGKYQGRSAEAGLPLKNNTPLQRVGPPSAVFSREKRPSKPPPKGPRAETAAQVYSSLESDLTDSDILESVDAVETAGNRTPGPRSVDIELETPEDSTPSQRHTRPVRSAEPEAEAIAGNRTPGPRSVDIEPETPEDSTPSQRHTRPVRSAEPEAEAIAGNRTPTGKGKPKNGSRATGDNNEVDAAIVRGD